MNAYQHLFFLVPMAVGLFVAIATLSSLRPAVNVIFGFAFAMFIVFFIGYVAVLIPALFNFYQHLGGLK